MDSMIAANRKAREFAEPYKELADGTVGWQERNVRLLQSLFEGAVRGAQRQTEANLELALELFERAEEQREILQRLAGKATRAYWNLALSFVVPFGSAVAVRGEVAEEPAPKTGDVAFPIVGYARLTSAKVIEKLDGLSVAQLKKVRAYEMEHKNRKALLANIEQRIQETR